MKNYIILIFIILLCFTMCKKQEINEDLCYSNTLISQINSGDLAVHGLTYNGNCLVNESTQPFVYKRFSYDADNTLRKVEEAFTLNSFSCVMIPGLPVESDPRKARINAFSEFEYDDALNLSKKSVYFIKDGHSQLTSWATYEYANGNIVKVSWYNPQGELTQYNDYTYDNNGNIIRDDQYSNNSGIKLLRTVICEFDNKNNPYRVFACEGEPGIYTNRNNITKETMISYNGSTESSYSILHVYEYNNLDYPVRINDLDCFYGKQIEK
jgi:hypothetical protein